eukprot:scaffold7788_cov32-Phaeocystis_antarctica.AAC.1
MRGARHQPGGMLAEHLTPVHCRSRSTAADSARSRVAWCGRSARAPRLTLSSSVNTRVYNPGAGRGKKGTPASPHTRAAPVPDFV